MTSKDLEYYKQMDSLIVGETELGRIVRPIGNDGNKKNVCLVFEGDGYKWEVGKRSKPIKDEKLVADILGRWWSMSKTTK